MIDIYVEMKTRKLMRGSLTMYIMHWVFKECVLLIMTWIRDTNIDQVSCKDNEKCTNSDGEVDAGDNFNGYEKLQMDMRKIYR